MRLDPPSLPGLAVTPTFTDLPNRFAEVARCDLVVTSEGGTATVSEVPTVVLQLSPGHWTAHWFSSDWGDEFTPQSAPADAPLRLEVTTGRSSKGMHPWLCLVDADGAAVIVAPAWSGNWRMDVQPGPQGAVEVRAGISPWQFERTVEPGRPFVAPSVYVSRGGDRSSAAAGLAEAFSHTAAPRTDQVWATWNHWWPYEDAEIDHETFLANTEVARDLGMDLATLDAGWFGPAAVDSFWERVRGDWDDENSVRFPQGTAGLAREVREHGVRFGVWCELEALGPDSVVAREHPRVVATGADGVSLGYVCLGSPAGREHARAILERLLDRTAARWVKIDFNLDPGAGCRRTDHGHAAGDGLYEHYRGLYALIDEVRSHRPDLIVEACSSGGLRIDLGLAAHVHCSFLSDPDWTEFHLQLLWGAAQLLPAASLFHFSESQWRGFHPFQNLDPKTVSASDFDASIRAVALHRWALSLKLVELSQDQRARLREHFRVQPEVVAPLLRDHAVIRPLTAQPLREGRGERWPAFQLQGADSHALMAVALDGHPGEQMLPVAGLAPEGRYRVQLHGPDATAADLPELDGSPSAVLTGARLAEGLVLRRTTDARSWLISIDPAGEDEHARRHG